MNDFNEEMSFKMGAKFAASFYTDKKFLCMYLYIKVPEVNYSQCEDKLDQ